jgi:hypothetical protein
MQVKTLVKNDIFADILKTSKLIFLFALFRRNFLHDSLYTVMTKTQMLQNAYVHKRLTFDLWVNMSAWGGGGGGNRSINNSHNSCKFVNA